MLRRLWRWLIDPAYHIQVTLTERGRGRVTSVKLHKFDRLIVNDGDQKPVAVLSVPTYGNLVLEVIPDQAR